MIRQPAAAYKNMDKDEETKQCGACRDQFAISGFSKKQWQLKSRRRCKECITSKTPISVMMNDMSINEKKVVGGKKVRVDYTVYT